MTRSVQGLLLCVLTLLLAGWGWPQLPAGAPPTRPVPASLNVPILMYHRISTHVVGLPGLTVAPRQFDAEMDWLHGHGFHAVTQLQLLAALEDGGRLPSRPVMITFDDGYRDVLWNAAPILHRLRMPATMYVITGRVDDGDPSFLTWGELGRLVGLGFDIGSHTVHHVELTQVPAATAFRELVDSREALIAHLHRPVLWFAYPAGRVDAAVVPLVRRAGYRLAVTTQPGSLQRGSEPFLLHRFEVLPATGVGGVRALVESAER